MKENRDNNQKQVPYLGRWVDREHFRAFVYDRNSQQKLAKSYDEFERLIASGIWFDSLDNLPRNEVKPSRKNKHEPAITVS